MKLMIEMNLDNAAFDYGNRDHEIATLLKGIARDFESGGYAGGYAFADSNGNRVGTVKIIKEKANG